MMGHQGGVQDKLFCSFNLDGHVPQNHLLRGIDRVFDLRDLRHHLTPFYSHTGRPSIDPELMMRMLIVGYCFGIRSDDPPGRDVARELAATPQYNSRGAMERKKRSSLRTSKRILKLDSIGSELKTATRMAKAHCHSAGATRNCCLGLH